MTTLYCVVEYSSDYDGYGEQCGELRIVQPDHINLALEAAELAADQLNIDLMYSGLDQEARYEVEPMTNPA